MRFPLFSRPVAGALLFAAYSLLSGAQASAANCTAPVVDGQLYRIANAGAGKVIDIAGGSLQSGTPAQLWDDAGSANQQFQVHDLGNGYWTLQGRQSGMLLDVAARVSADGARVAFTSGTDPLTADDTNGAPDIYVADLRERTITLVSPCHASSA